MISGLPIDEAVPPLLAALADGPNAVLIAPPGAGKTTLVPLAIKDESWLAGRRIIVLEPRRLAARAAARRMAQTLGEQPGETVGYRVRMESRIGPKTRIEVVTEGVFTRMILDDPGLEGVGAVLFDEFHERSLDADLGLALALEAQAVLRPDLRLVVMSATLDGGAVSSRIGAPVIESLGRAFPVETRYLGRPGRIDDGVTRAILKALDEETGSVLAFLPGQGEIRRVEERLAERGRRNVIVAPLYGALDFKAQDLAVSPAPAGQRKVVLATAIAQTSLTIEGVRVVVDSGQSRVARFDPASGLNRLETVRVSRATADQRQGRAGRTEPGVCYRLWDEPETRGLMPFDRPEILETDLSGLVLDLARWGARDPSALMFLDPPPKGAWDQAEVGLKAMGALDAEGRLTPHGARIADLPLPALLAHMLVRAGEAGSARTAARIAVLLTERGLGGSDADLTHRLERLDRDGAGRAKEARGLADRWARLVGGKDAPGDPGLMLAEAFPDRIAKARGKPGEYLLASGRGVFIEPTDALARCDWLAVGELGGGASRDRILLAAPLDEADLKAAFADRFETEDRLDLDAPGGATATRRIKLGALVIEERRIDRPDPAMIAGALLGEVRRRGLAALPLGDDSASLLGRIAFLRRSDETWPDLSEAALIAGLDDWLAPLLAGKRRLTDLTDGQIASGLRTLIPWDMARRLDAEAPERFAAPTGSTFRIDYSAEAGPTVAVRVQELYGLASHPTLGLARTPITFELLSPAHRPVQVTRDLPGFWKGSWPDVRRDMRGRYPKHVWPEDPTTAAPTTRAKPRGT